MKHTYEKKWTDELIQSEIIKVKEALNLNRMPTRKEISKVMGNESLTGKISKTIGYYGWAKKLGLNIKNSETTFGKAYECYATEWLENLGYKVDKMSQNYPFDLLINDNIKIDIKTSNLYKGSKGSYYTFNLEKRYATCDIYICVCVENNNIKKTLIIPSKDLRLTQLSIGKKSIYDKYIDRYDYIQKYDYLYKNI
jgi:hypothetical protein